MTEPTPRRPLLSYCVNNVDDAARALLRAHACATAEEHCLQRCGACYEGPFLLLDGQFFSGPSHHAILDALPVAQLALAGKGAVADEVAQSMTQRPHGE